MRIHYLAISALGAMLSLPGIGQTLLNNGSQIRIQDGGAVHLKVNGSLNNQTGGTLRNAGQLTVAGDLTNQGSLAGSGQYTLYGSWTNDNSFAADNSLVLLTGNAQYIGGTSLNSFHHLQLAGTGIKYLDNSADISYQLDLNDRELEVGDHLLTIGSTETEAITRSSGFVSTTGSGSLQRHTALSTGYLFPVGSSQGTLRYRPVEITPASGDAHVFAVGFANYSATTDGYDLGDRDATVCDLNTDFYHRITQPSGTNSAGVAIHFNTAEDGNWTGIGYWESIWRSAGKASVSGGASESIALKSWSRFDTEPYVLIDPCAPERELVIYDILTPNEDGKNDHWQIDNIEQYTNNRVTIYNRWGDVVYGASPYQNDWKGTRKGKDLPEAAYYYLVDLGDGSDVKSGTLTIIR